MKAKIQYCTGGLKDKEMFHKAEQKQTEYKRKRKVETQSKKYTI